MKDRFDGLVEHLLDGGLFLQQAIEILEKKHDPGRAGAQPAATSAPPPSNSESIAIRCSGKWWSTKLGGTRTRARRKPAARAGQSAQEETGHRVDMDLLIFDLGRHADRFQTGSGARR